MEEQDKIFIEYTLGELRYMLHEFKVTVEVLVKALKGEYSRPYEPGKRSREDIGTDPIPSYSISEDDLVEWEKFHKNMTKTDDISEKTEEENDEKN